MKKLTKRIGQFAMGSVVLGGSAAVVGKAYPGYAGGLSAMGSGMPAIGSTMIMGGLVRITGGALHQLPKFMKPKKRRR